VAVIKIEGRPKILKQTRRRFFGEKPLRHGMLQPDRGRGNPVLDLA
jgi:hypothetical protein